MTVLELNSGDAMLTEYATLVDGERNRNSFATSMAATNKHGVDTNNHSNHFPQRRLNHSSTMSNNSSHQGTTTVGPFNIGVMQSLSASSGSTLSHNTMQYGTNGLSKTDKLFVEPMTSIGNGSENDVYETLLDSGKGGSGKLPQSQSDTRTPVRQNPLNIFYRPRISHAPETDLSQKIAALQSEIQQYQTLQRKFDALEKSFLNVKLELAEHKAKNDIYEKQLADLKYEVAKSRASQVEKDNVIKELESQKKQMKKKLANLEIWRNKRISDMKKEMEMLTGMGRRRRRRNKNGDDISFEFDLFSDGGHDSSDDDSEDDRHANTLAAQLALFNIGDNAVQPYAAQQQQKMENDSSSSKQNEVKKFNPMTRRNSASLVIPKEFKNFEASSIENGSNGNNSNGKTTKQPAQGRFSSMMRRASAPMILPNEIKFDPQPDIDAEATPENQYGQEEPVRRARTAQRRNSSSLMIPKHLKVGNPVSSKQQMRAAARAVHDELNDDISNEQQEPPRRARTAQRRNSSSLMIPKHLKAGNVPSSNPQILRPPNLDDDQSNGSKHQMHDIIIIQEKKSPEKVQPKQQIYPQIQSQPKQQIQPQTKIQTNYHTMFQSQPQDKPQPKPQDITQSKAQAKLQEILQTKPKEKPQIKPQTKPQDNLRDKPQIIPQAKPQDIQQKKTLDLPKENPQGKSQLISAITQQTKPQTIFQSNNDKFSNNKNNNLNKLEPFILSDGQRNLFQNNDNEGKATNSSNVLEIKSMHEKNLSKFEKVPSIKNEEEKKFQPFQFQDGKQNYFPQSLSLEKKVQNANELGYKIYNVQNNFPPVQGMSSTPNPSILTTKNKQISHSSQEKMKQDAIQTNITVSTSGKVSNESNANSHNSNYSPLTNSTEDKTQDQTVEMPKIKKRYDFSNMNNTHNLGSGRSHGGDGGCDGSVFDDEEDDLSCDWGERQLERRRERAQLEEQMDNLHKQKSQRKPSSFAFAFGGGRFLRPNEKYHEESENLALQSSERSKVDRHRHPPPNAILGANSRIRRRSGDRTMSLPTPHINLNKQGSISLMETDHKKRFSLPGLWG